MKPAGIAIVALVASAVAFVWFTRPPETRPVNAMVALILCAFLVRLIPQLQPSSRTESTMGLQGDGLIGFEAEVGAIEPLQVKAQGAVWQARLVKGGGVRPGARVKIVGRDGLTLLVQGGGGRDA